MRRKKLLAGICAAAMALGMVPMGVYAAEPDQDKSTTVTYSVANTYELSIPSEVSLDMASERTQTIGVSETNIANGSQLDIKITTNQVTMSRSDGKKVSSTITAINGTSGILITGASLANPVTIGSYEGVITSETKKQTLVFSAPVDADEDNDVIEAGTYTGTLMFKASISTN
ncbi:MAG: hypothetical protein EOM40_08050 [Clostridia bacterium]|nr:hypothetical protein [Clostridia bacterium]